MLLSCASSMGRHSWSATQQHHHQLGQATSQLCQWTGIDDVRHHLWLSTGTQVMVDLSHRSWSTCHTSHGRPVTQVMVNLSHRSWSTCHTGHGRPVTQVIGPVTQVIGPVTQVRVDLWPPLLAGTTMTVCGVEAIRERPLSSRKVQTWWSDCEVSH